MGKLECFRISGVDCWFYSNDHRPPHFHAKRRGQWEVRVYFLRARRDMVELKWVARGCRFTETTAICDLAEAHRDKLLEEWEKKVKCDEDDEAD
jgi:hypothetical protein